MTNNIKDLKKEFEEEKLEIKKMYGVMIVLTNAITIIITATIFS